MNKKMKHLLATFCLLLCASAASAQTSHWTQVSANDFQYDMTIFFTLGETDDNDVFTEVEDLSNYEVAAFVGSELRGVAEIWTVGTENKKVGYLRVRSNEASGEKLTFKFYDKTAQVEKTIFGTDVTFNNQDQQGEASNPLQFAINGGLPGDVDGDGEITINDVTMTIDAALGHPAENFIEAAADVDNDGEITINDVTTIIDMALGKIKINN